MTLAARKRGIYRATAGEPPQPQVLSRLGADLARQLAEHADLLRTTVVPEARLLRTRLVSRQNNRKGVAQRAPDHDRFAPFAKAK